MRSNHLICFTAAAILLLASPVLLGGDSRTAITGIVDHPSAKTFPTIVYIDEAPQEGAAPPSAATLELNRKGFSPSVLAVVTGATVKFVNKDTRQHSVFSPDGEKYDLGELGGGAAKEHTFAEPGVYAQLCLKHPQHIGYVVVLKNRYFTMTDESGRFRLAGTPPGAWKLKVWNAGLVLGQSRQSYEVHAAAGQETTANISIPPLPSIEKFWLEPPPPGKAGLVERGAWLYQQRGCFLCHGEQGTGGVQNRNYVKRTIPQLDTLAERLMLFDADDVRSLIQEMDRGKDLEALRDDPPVPRFEAVLAQYDSVRDVITKGSPAGKMHPKGPKPPLDMPRNSDVSQRDIQALVAYLLSLQGSDGKRD